MKRGLSLDSGFLKEFFRLATPIILTNIMGASLHILDNIMVGSLGEVELAGVALANQLAFVLRLTLFGISSGCAIFASQHWGHGDVDGVRRAMGISLITALGMSCLAASWAVLAPQSIMRIFSPDADVIEMGASYLRIVGVSYVASSVTAVYGAANRSTERVRLNMAASMTALVINTFLNWCLIYGRLGFPKLGVTGAATATVIAVAAEVTILVSWTYLKRYPAAATLKQMLPTSWAFVGRYYRVAIPVMLNEGVWALGVSAYSAIYGRISTQAVAAMNVFGTVDQLVMAAVYGAMHAAGVMVGKRIGAGEKAEAMACAKRMLGMSVIMAAVMGVVLILTRRNIAEVFNISREAKDMAVGVMAVASFAMWAKAFNAVNVVGVLRAGGDTVFSMILDCGAIWLIGVPMAWLGGLFLDWPLPMVFILMQAEEMVKVVIGLKRFVSGKWINTLINVS